MTIEKDLVEIINSTKIEKNINNLNFQDDIKINPGIIVERSLVHILSDSGYFDENYIIPSFFEKSSTGGYNLVGDKKRVLFEIDDYKLLNSKPSYIEVKSGEIVNSYLDFSYYSQRQKVGTKVDIKRIFHLSNKFGINPSLYVFYNESIAKNKKLMKRVQRDFKGRLYFIGFNFDFEYVKEFSIEHNRKALKIQRGKKINLDELY